MSKITRNRLKELIGQIIKEMDFEDEESFKKYQSQHKMRPTTKVNIAGKETTVGQASGGDDGGGEGKLSDTVKDLLSQIGKNEPIGQDEAQDALSDLQSGGYDTSKLQSAYEELEQAEMSDNQKMIPYHLQEFKKALKNTVEARPSGDPVKDIMKSDDSIDQSSAEEAIDGLRDGGHDTERVENVYDKLHSAQLRDAPSNTIRDLEKEFKYAIKMSLAKTRLSKEKGDDEEKSPPEPKKDTGLGSDGLPKQGGAFYNQLNQSLDILKDKPKAKKKLFSKIKSMFMGESIEGKPRRTTVKEVK